MDLLKKILKNTDLWFLLIVLLASFLVRWYQIEKQPYGLEGDEFSWTITSFFNQYKIPAEQKGIWSMHTDMAKSYPTSIFINKIGFLIFGQDMLSTRKILVVVSAISLAIFYLLCRSFYSQFISLIITLFYSFSYYKLISTRIAMAPAYIDIFLYFSFFCLIKSFSLRSKLKYLLAGISGIGMVLCLFTCNIAYIVPIICIGFIVFQFFNPKVSKKQCLLILFIFLLPLIYFSSKWIYDFKQEEGRKSYALSRVVFDLRKKQLILSQVKENLQIIDMQLFKGLIYETRDMLVAYDNPLIPKSITVLAIFGLLITLTKLRKYFFVVLWFVLSLGTSVAFGLFLPRMWVISVGSFFTLAGISLSFLEAWIIKKNFALIFNIIIVIFGLIYIKSNLNIFYLKALYSPSYLSKHREIVDLIKKHKRNIPTKIIFISTPDFNHGVIYPAVVFYFLADHPHSMSIIMKADDHYFQVLNEDELVTKLETNSSSIKFIIIDNSLINNIKVKDNLNKLKDRILEQKSYKDFTEISLI